MPHRQRHVSRVHPGLSRHPVSSILRAATERQRRAAWQHDKAMSVISSERPTSNERECLIVRGNSAHRLHPLRPHTTLALTLAPTLPKSNADPTPDCVCGDLRLGEDSAPHLHGSCPSSPSSEVLSSSPVQHPHPHACTFRLYAELTLTLTLMRITTIRRNHLSVYGPRTTALTPLSPALVITKQTLALIITTLSGDLTTLSVALTTLSVTISIVTMTLNLPLADMKPSGGAWLVDTGPSH